MPSEALKVTTAVTVGALLLLGFAYYRYSVSSRKKKRKDEDEIEIDSNSSIEIKKQSPLTATLPSHSVSDSPSKTSNISISITKKENGQIVDEFEKKEEARRVIQKVLSEKMIQNSVSDSSKKILEETLDGLDDRKSTISNRSRSVSSEKFSESPHYVPFEEILKRKSMERSPTPTQSKYGPSSLPSGSSSPTKSYIHLSRESSFVREEKGTSPKKETEKSPTFELFKSKRTSVEKEVTEVITTSANTSPRQLSPESFTTLQNTFATNSNKDNSFQFSTSENGVSIKEPKLLLNSFNQIPMNGTDVEGSSKSNFSTENAQTLIESDVKTSVRESFSRETTEERESHTYHHEEPIQLSLASQVSASLSPNQPSTEEVTSVQNSNTQELTRPDISAEDTAPQSIEPSSLEIVTLKPRILQEEDEPSPSFEKMFRKPSYTSEPEVESMALPNEGVKEEECAQEIPPLETLPTSTLASQSDSLVPTAESVHSDDSDKNDKFASSSTNFRPGWAKSSKVNGNHGHAWEKGVAEKGWPIPKSNSGEEDDEMSLLSKSQEKGLHSKAPLLSDSDEEEVKLPEEPLLLSKPLVMEGIREESEEPEEPASATSTAHTKTTKKQDSKGRSKKKNRKK